MKDKVDIIYEDHYYKLIHKESVGNLEMYLKLINWVSGEFDVYLQDESSSLVIYYPSGWLSIKCNLQRETKIIVEFTVISKSKKSCQNMFIQLAIIYNHMRNIYGCNKQIINELQQ